LFRLSLRLITSGGRSAHLAYLGHKSGRKTSIIIIIIIITHTLVAQDHPSAWKLIETLQVECAHVTGVLIQDERDIRPKKKKTPRKIYTELKKRLRNFCENRFSGVMSFPEFVVSLSLKLRVGQTNISIRLLKVSCFKCQFAIKKCQ